MKSVFVKAILTVYLTVGINCSTGIAQNGWTSIYTGNQLFTDIEFLNERIGWATGAATADFTIWRSDDGGITWTGVVPWHPSTIVSDLIMFDTLTGIATNGGALLITADAFETWDNVGFVTDTGFTDLVYLDSTHLIGAGTADRIDYWVNHIYTSDDGGYTWTNQFLDSCYEFLCNFHKICLSELGTAIVTYLPNRVMRGMNEGQTWTEIDNLPVPWINGVQSSAPGVFYAAGMSDLDYHIAYPLIARSLDDGLTWQLVWSDPILVGAPASNIAFPDSLHGWVVGRNGLVVETEDGGTTWQHYTLSESEFNGVSFFDSTLGWAATAWEIFRYSNPTETDHYPNCAMPLGMSVASAHPNPFNSSTRISFTLPHPSHATLKVFDVTGRAVATLMNGNAKAGEQRVLFNAAELPSGIYFARLDADPISQTKKLLLLR